MIRLGLLDKNELFRESLHFAIDSRTELSVELSASSFKSCQEILSPGKIDALLVDIEKIDAYEHQILRKLVHHFPEIEVIVLSNSLTRKKIVEALPLGIRVFICKNTSIDQLSDDVQRALKAKGPLDVIVPERFKSVEESPNFQDINDIDDFFSPRETEILDMVCRELSNSEIAKELNLSVRTIETHRRRMIEKTNSKTMIGVILFAMNRDWKIAEKSDNRALF